MGGSGCLWLWTDREGLLGWKQGRKVVWVDEEWCCTEDSTEFASGANEAETLVVFEGDCHYELVVRRYTVRGKGVAKE